MFGSGSLLTLALSVGCSTTIRGPVDLERRRGPRDRPVGDRGAALLFFLFLLFLLLASLTKGADYGGRMVYDYNAGGNACGQPIDFSQ
jgi:hypothetical protein